jgi:hypothetical protein
MDKLGVDEIFDRSNQDFSLMAANENIYLNSMPHRWC